MANVYYLTFGSSASAGGRQPELADLANLLKTIHYIILNNGILKSNSLIFPPSGGYITQYTP